MASAQEYRTLRTQPRQGGKQRGHTEKHATKRTDRNARHGFLNHAFVPVISQRLASLGQPREIEREFFNSLSHLASLYGFSMSDCPQADYPLNIVQGFEWARLQMRMLRPDLHLILVKDTEHRSTIATVKTFDTGSYLYYIPVKPLYLLLNSKKTKPQAHLLLSVFGYMYQIVQIPYLTEGYLSNVYEMIHSWYLEDPSGFDEEEYQAVLEEFRVMGYAGSRLWKSIKHPYHVRQFANRVQRFRPATPNDEELLAVSTKLLNLYKQYSDRSVFDNIKEGLLYPSEDERIMPYQYISFFWNGEGEVYQQVMEMVNVHFQEIAYMEEPLTVQLFDTPQAEERHDLDFEEQLFACMYELNEYLNEA